jgi:xylose isomerase
MTKRILSMPFWCVENPVGDPFGRSVMDPLSALEVCDLLCEARRDGLIELTASHDDNLVDWDPANPQDDQDPGSGTSRTLRELKKRLEAAGLRLVMITCDLHGNPVFRNGGLTNPNPGIRLLAAQKVLRAIRIGHFFGAEYLTYWVARDGFETQFALPWERSFRYLIEGLNLARRYIRDNKLSIRKGSIESKPNEPRGEMLLPTTGHALALADALEEPDFWGVNPEILQHEAMTNLSPFVALALAVVRGKLNFVHLGNQKPGQFDNDSPTMIGMSGVKELVGVLWMLERMGWKGHFEFDNHVLRTDTAPGSQNALEIRRDFIRVNVENFRLAESKADELAADRELAALQQAVWGELPAAADLLAGGDWRAILQQRPDYARLNGQAVRIARLDTRANRLLLGL